MSNNEVFKELADPTRREILRLLRKSELSAGQLAEALEMTRPSMSHHFDSEVPEFYRTAGVGIARH